MVRISNLAAATVAIALAASAANGATQLTTQLIINGLARPVWCGSPPGDTTRLFIVEQNTAKIRIIDLLTNTIVPGPDYLSILPKVQTAGNEQGLLGMTFDPDYANNRFVYVNYTRAGDAATIVERYQTFANNPNRADAATATIMLGPIAQPFSNHNGGNLAFGPDGYLYVGTGDGGSGGDPQCNAQKGTTLLGKMLRLDVSTVPASAPASNPFVGNPSFDARIWAYGLRNPWRYSFDVGTGDLYIGDVGQDQREEIDWRSAASTGGENYGWKVKEGTACFSTAACPGGTPTCTSGAFVEPVVDFTHGGGNCSVTGGVVYRGAKLPSFKGTYFYADYCSGSKWTFKLVGGVVTGLVDREVELDPPGALVINNVTHIGTDAAGEIYFCDQSGGEIYRVVAANLAGTDLGFGKAGGNGLVPALVACGTLATGGTADITLGNAAPNSLALLFGSTASNPTATIAGTLVPVPPALTLALFTDANGEINLPANNIGGGPFTFNIQYAIADAGAVNGASSSNAFALNILP